MKGFTIISYPTQKNDNLLSLTQKRSRYMLPLGGRFRIADFTIRNSVSSGANSTIIYTGKENDGLKRYLKEYQKANGDEEKEIHEIKTFALTKSSLNSVLDVITECKTSQFVLYNGDNPSIVDFKHLMDKFNSSKKKSLLFKLKVEGKATMAHKIVICDKRTLLSVIKKAISQKFEAPNFFEMIINMLIHKGISVSSIDAYYWPIKNLNEYFSLNREIIWNSEISKLLQQEGVLRSQIKSDEYALIDTNGSAVNSFLSDYCYINGKVENSIIFPGVEIHEKAFVKNSIILPFVKIGPGARIMNTIVDENMDTESEEYTIGEKCRIGSDDEHIKNNNFPKLLNSSLTLVGKNNILPKDAQIGGACYVSPGSAEEYFLERSILKDGETIL